MGFLFACCCHPHMAAVWLFSTGIFHSFNQKFTGKLRKIVRKAKDDEIHDVNR